MTPCLWKDVAGSQAEDGKRRVKCERCGTTTAPTIHPVERIHGRCRAFPFWWEAGHWAALLLEAIGLSKRRWAWLWSKAGMVEPTGCGSCAAREKWLNTWGGKLEMRRRAVVAWLTGVVER
jgi:hypothetical protein